METNELIRRLSRDVPPVRRLLPWNARFSMWLAFALSWAALGVTWVGWRPDRGKALADPHFLVLGGLMLATAILSGLTAFRLSVPGVESSRWHRWLPGATAIAWIGILIVELWLAYHQQGLAALDPGNKHRCVYVFAGLGLGPGLGMALMIRQAASLEKRWNGMFLALASASVAALGVSFFCTFEQPAHVLVYHIMPVVVFTLAGFWLGDRWLSAR